MPTLYKWRLLERSFPTKAKFPTWLMSEQDAERWAQKFGCRIEKIADSGRDSGAQKRTRRIVTARSSPAAADGPRS